MQREQQQQQSNNQLKGIGIFLRGMAMGAADVVPGVSGGTIALITGIYERLIAAIASITKQALPALKKEGVSIRGVKKIWEVVDGTFLVLVALGIATSILSVAKLIGWGLAEYPIIVWSFFFGLVLASTYFVARMVKKRSTWLPYVAVLATFLTSYLVMSAPVTTPNTLPFVFLAGFIAISAMILPGISGSFILVLLGKYAYILEALNTRDIPVVLVFLAGCGLGILSAARFINWLFKRYHDVAITLIVGIMAGSLVKIWPWKVVTSTRIDSHGEVVPVTQSNLWPWQYTEQFNEPSFIIWAVVALILGIVIVGAFNRLASR